jgi:hypothetical protein
MQKSQSISTHIALFIFCLFLSPIFATFFSILHIVKLMKIFFDLQLETHVDNFLFVYLQHHQYNDHRRIRI